MGTGMAHISHPPFASVEIFTDAKTDRAENGMLNRPWQP
ncbi:hypothetical protein AWB80_07377 [Caballeronia pedi]|uniref:Uncharacterized protein n=1 Tax=Caballeronia pedi TaxID=1777141 RepID=A0A158DST3_9BURK|nr:hypothetical protein AWB80_07377 [Caballeronia pedi]